MIIKQKWIRREDLKANPSFLYLFGDNFDRRGMGGQAKEMRGEPNSMGIPTKMSPAMDEDSFFSDENYNMIVLILTMHFKRIAHHLMKGGTVVIPMDGLGTGLSQLKQRAPRINQKLEELIEELYTVEEQYNETQ